MCVGGGGTCAETCADTSSKHRGCPSQCFSFCGRKRWARNGSCNCPLWQLKICADSVRSQHTRCTCCRDTGLLVSSLRTCLWASFVVSLGRIITGRVFDLFCTDSESFVLRNHNRMRGGNIKPVNGDISYPSWYIYHFSPAFGETIPVSELLSPEGNQENVIGVPVHFKGPPPTWPWIMSQFSMLRNAFGWNSWIQTFFVALNGVVDDFQHAWGAGGQGTERMRLVEAKILDNPVLSLVEVFSGIVVEVRRLHSTTADLSQIFEVCHQNGPPAQPWDQLPSHHHFKVIQVVCPFPSLCHLWQLFNTSSFTANIWETSGFALDSVFWFFLYLFFESESKQFGSVSAIIKVKATSSLSRCLGLANLSRLSDVCFTWKLHLWTCRPTFDWTTFTYFLDSLQNLQWVSCSHFVDFVDQELKSVSDARRANSRVQARKIDRLCIVHNLFLVEQKKWSCFYPAVGSQWCSQSFNYTNVAQFWRQLVGKILLHCKWRPQLQAETGFAPFWLFALKLRNGNMFELEGGGEQVKVCLNAVGCLS